MGGGGGGCVGSLNGALWATYAVSKIGGGGDYVVIDGCDVEAIFCGGSVACGGGNRGGEMYGHSSEPMAAADRRPSFRRRCTNGAERTRKENEVTQGNIKPLSTSSCLTCTAPPSVASRLCTAREPSPANNHLTRRLRG